MQKSNKWKLIWSDEFDKNGLPNPKKWGYEEGLIRNHELQFYTKQRRENARVENGNLILEARKELYKGSKFTSASINTLGKFGLLYGRVEVRAKLPRARGTWPAIWMMGEDINTVGWPRCGEIDIMEHVAFNHGIIHSTVHQAQNKADGKVGEWSSGSSIKIPDCSDAFHVYAMEWYKDHMDFFVDEKKFFTFKNEDGKGNKGKWAFDKRQYLLLNLAVGGDWGGQKGVDESAFPQQYKIDYVRVYQV
jgi:beta-glucanase (GH16 family)